MDTKKLIEKYAKEHETLKTKTWREKRMKGITFDDTLLYNFDRKAFMKMMGKTPPE